MTNQIEKLRTEADALHDTDRAAWIAKHREIDVIRDNQPAIEIDVLKSGDGVTVVIYTDSEAFTILKRTAKTMTIQEDSAKLTNGDKLEFHPGGFCAHCSNQHIQDYDYTPNLDGRIVKITRRVWTDRDGHQRVMWKRAGSRTRERGGYARPGRRKFHDYNF